MVIKGIVGTFIDATARISSEQQKVAALEQAAQIERQRAEEAEMHRAEQVRFVDMICHEIRNPLNGLWNSIELLKESRLQLKQSLQERIVLEESKRERQREKAQKRTGLVAGKGKMRMLEEVAEEEEDGESLSQFLSKLMQGLEDEVTLWNAIDLCILHEVGNFSLATFSVFFEFILCLFNFNLIRSFISSFILFILLFLLLSRLVLSERLLLL